MLLLIKLRPFPVFLGQLSTFFHILYKLLIRSLNGVNLFFQVAPSLIPEIITRPLLHDCINDFDVAICAHFMLLLRMRSVVVHLVIPVSSHLRFAFISQPLLLHAERLVRRFSLRSAALVVPRHRLPFFLPDPRSTGTRRRQRRCVLGHTSSSPRVELFTPEKPANANGGRKIAMIDATRTQRSRAPPILRATY